MNKLLKLKSQSNVRNLLNFALNKSVHFETCSNEATAAQLENKTKSETDVVFGTGSKYAELDSVKQAIKSNSMYKIKHSNRKDKVKNKHEFDKVQKEAVKEDDVVFGTLSDELDSM
jgi:hypothetical protein